MRFLLLILGGLTLGAAAHLAQVSDEGWLPLGPQAEGHVAALAVNERGRLYAGTQDGELYTRTDDSWRATAREARLVAHPITALLPGEPFFIGTTQGLYTLDGNQAAPVAALPALAVRELIRDGAGGVLLAEVQGDIYHAAAGEAWRRVPRAGLPDGVPVYRLLVHGGRLHAGTVGAGVYTLGDDEPWTPLGTGLPEDTKVFALWPLTERGLVAGTDAGAWRLDEGGQWRRLGVGLDRQRVLDLTTYREGNTDVLLAASDEALWRLPVDQPDAWWQATDTLVPLAKPVARVVVSDGEPYLAAGPVYGWAVSRSDRLGVALLGGTGMVLIILALWLGGRQRRR
ncbi:hypothetical protein HUS23_06385 [Ectothiorhodospiraceae bacterium 2226]|nr:hypothetical protein HUS23_06385 [Ectothiorhodospiraceae bacterium 2226]